MNYPETINWLYEQLPMFSRIGQAAYKTDLHNTIALCAILGNPEKKFRSVHIAGTNGKGSTSHMLAAICQTAGYKTGLYTSPHIHDFRERIRINGEMISEQAVVEFVGRMKEACTEIKPSFFELTVAMAFEYFACEQVDIAIIETGLGGRLDSTNIITPVLSVITNIGYDHMNLLGDTLEKIAWEKAGIIKKGIQAVIGEMMPETRPVFETKARDSGSVLYEAGNYYEVLSTQYEDGQMICELSDKKNHRRIDYRLDLAGQYQRQNLCTVLTATRILNKSGFHLPDEQVQSALRSVKKLTGLAGRWDLIRRRPDLILDVGHNKDGIAKIMMQLEEQYPQGNWHFVMGFVNDKDLSGVLSLFDPSKKYYFTQAHIPRALPADMLREQAGAMGLKGESFDDVNEALETALGQACEDDVVIVCGSFFVIAEINQALFSL